MMYDELMLSAVLVSRKARSMASIPYSTAPVESDWQGR